MKETINWGIMGPGRIAHKFVQALKTIDNAKITAVGSRDKSRAEAFSKQYGIAKSYGSYEELAADPDTDIIYVATPHPFHRDCVKLCLNGGKAVLCEKPFTMNARDTRELVELAREKKLFLMEAMWTRFFPVIKKVRQWLNEGAIGDLQMFRAEFGFGGEHDPKDRLLNPELGGGALLDLGIYPVSFASMIFGRQPETIHSIACIGPTGVDEQCTMIFGYDNGKMASLSVSFRTYLSNEAWIFGTHGNIHIAPEFHRASKAVLIKPNGEEEIFESPYESTGYQFEALEAMDCIRNGRTESEIMPLDESIAVMETLDKMRDQWQLRYPNE